jgi:hypothetical protein
VERHPDSFPPIVFNVTDGEATDVEIFDELVEAAAEIKANKTNDGNVLLFNMLLLAESEETVEFPLVSEGYLFDDSEHHKALFLASSTIPENLKRNLPVKQNEPEEVKGLVLNNLENVIKFLNIGTSTLRNTT